MTHTSTTTQEKNTTPTSPDTGLLVAILVLVVCLLIIVLFVLYYLKTHLKEVPSLIKQAQTALNSTAGSFGEVWKDVVVPGLKTAFTEKLKKLPRARR